MAQGTTYTPPVAALVSGGGSSPHRSLFDEITNVLGQGADTVASTAKDSITGLWHMAGVGIHHPERLAQDVAKSYWEDFSHPLRNPWYTAMDIASLAPTPFAFLDRGAEAGRVLAGASGWADKAVTARRLIETPEGESQLLHTVTPIDTKLTRSPARQFMQAIVHGSPVPERILKEYAQTPTEGIFTKATGPLTREQRGLTFSKNLGYRQAQRLLDEAHATFPNVRMPFRTQAGRVGKAARAETRQIKAAARKESMQLLKQYGKSPDGWHEAVAMELRGTTPEAQLKWIDDQVALGGHSSYVLKNFKAWRARTEDAAQHMEEYTHTTEPTYGPEGALEPTLHPDQLSMDVAGATGPRAEVQKLPDTPMTEVKVGDKITFMGKAGIVTDLKDAGPFYHTTLDGKATLPIPKHANVNVERTIQHEAPAATQVLTAQGPQKMIHPGGTYILGRIKESAPKDLRDYRDKARLVSNARSSALLAAGNLTPEEDFTRRLGPYNVMNGHGLIPDLQKMRNDIRTQEAFGHADNATKLRTQLNYWLKQLNQPALEGEQTALDFADLPKPIVDPKLAEKLSRVPEKQDFATRMRDFMRPWRGGKPKIPGTLSHAYTGAYLRHGGPAANTARLLAESHIEAQRFLYLNAVRADLLTRAHDTPAGIPASQRLPIVTDYYKGHFPVGFHFPQRAMEEGIENKSEAEAASRWYEPVRQLFFDPASALQYAKDWLSKNPEQQSGLNYLKQRGAPFSSIQDLEHVPVPGIKWVDKRWLGGLDKQNPLWSLMDYSIGRKLVHLADTVNDASKLMLLYMKPSYLIPNFLGNVGLTLVHQGFLAPLNLTKTLYTMFTGRGLSKDVVFMIKSLMGEGFSGTLENENTLRGLMARASNKAAGLYGKLIDDPFRFAAFLHEARLAGFTTLEDVEKLVKDSRYQASLHDVATRANEALIDYERLGPGEQSIIRRMVFFYPWVKGSSRYGYRMFIDHPSAAAVNVYAGKSGKKYIDSKLGPVPAYDEGFIPLGGGKVLNPNSMSILGTGGDLVEAARNTFSGHPNPDLSLIGNMAPADLFPFTLLTGQTAIPHPQKWSPFHAALHQAYANPFFGTPSSILEQATGPGTNPISQYPGDTLQSTILRTMLLGGTMPREFYDRYANYRKYLENPRAYHDDRVASG